MKMRYLLFIFFVLLFFANVKAEEGIFGLNPFLTQEEREMFRKKSKYEELLGPELSAILFYPGNNKAIIDGKIIKEGDTVNGKKVLEINPESVILTDLQRKFILELSTPAPFAESGMAEQRKEKDE